MAHYLRFITIQIRHKESFRSKSSQGTFWIIKDKNDIYIYILKITSIKILGVNAPIPCVRIVSTWKSLSAGQKHTWIFLAWSREPFVRPVGQTRRCIKDTEVVWSHCQLIYSFSLCCWDGGRYSCFCWYWYFCVPKCASRTLNLFVLRPCKVFFRDKKNIYHQKMLGLGLISLWWPDHSGFIDHVSSLRTTCFDQGDSRCIATFFWPTCTIHRALCARYRMRQNAAP